MRNLQMRVLALCVVNSFLTWGCTHPAEVCENIEMRVDLGGETPEGESVAEVVAPFEGEYDVVATAEESNDVYNLNVNMALVGDSFDYTDSVATDEFGECGDTMSGEVQLTIVGEEGQFNEDVRAELLVYFGPEGEVEQRSVSARIPRDSMQSDFGLASVNYEALLVTLYIQEGGGNGYIDIAKEDGDGSPRHERVYDIQSPE